MAVVILSRDAAAQVDALPLKIRTRVLSVVHRLERWPAVSGAKPLRGELAGHCRVRTGDYRVQFLVRGETVLIEKVGHRDGFYDETR
jgi:mRNA-degrading endonuclease RelE of RelBE toxin-antitoxin system